MSDGKVKIDVELQKRNFEKQLKNMEKQSESSGNRIANTFRKVAGRLALGKLAKDFMSAGINFNSTMETYTANFKVMLGSQEAATKKVQELKEMASKTPFEMKDLADATQTLLSFQVPAEKTQTVIKQLGDISLGNSEKLKGLALVFGQVSSAGKLTGQDLMQFINQGFNPLNYIAKRTGESMEELRDRMSKGGISAEEVAQSFEDATKKGGQFYKGMEEGSKTFAGQISTMKDNFNEFAGAVTKPIFDYLTNTAVPSVIKVLGFLNEHIKEVQIAITTLGTAYVGFKSVKLLGKAWEMALENLVLYLNGEAGLKVSSAIVGQLTGHVNLLQLAMKKLRALTVTAMLKGATAQMTLMEIKTKALAGATTLWSKALKLLPFAKYALIAGAVAGLATAFGLAAKKAGGVDKLLQNIGETISGLVEKIVTNAPKFIESGVQIIQSILLGMQEAFPKIVEFLSSQLPQMINAGANMLVSLLDGFTAQLPTLIEAGTNIIVQFVDNITANLPRIIDAGVSIIENLANGIANSVPKIIGVGATLVISLAGALIKNLPKIVGASIKIVVTLTTTIIKNLPKIIATALKIVVTLASTIIKNLPKIVSATIKIVTTLVSTIIKNLPKIIEAGVKLITTLVSTLIKNLPRIVSAGVKMLGAVVTGILKVIGKLITAGAEIVSKLWNGISNKTGWLSGKVTGFARNIPTYVKNGIGKITEVGSQLVSGIWQGIAGKIGWLKNKISSGMAGIKEHFKKVFDIHSPSKWSERVIGENIMLGIGNGIDKLKGKLKEKVSGVYSTIVDGLDSAFDNFQNAINRTMGELDLFGVVKREVVDGSGLLEALESQVTTMEDYVATIEALKDKGVSDSLLEELKSKGLSATDELMALSQMTQEELEAYEALYAKKRELAETINWDDYSKEAMSVLGDAGKGLEELMEKAEKSTNKTFKNTVNNVKDMVNDVVAEYNLMKIKICDIISSIPAPSVPSVPTPASSGSSSTVNNDNRSVTQNFYNKTTSPYESYRRVGRAFEN